MSTPFKSPTLYAHWRDVPLAAFKARWPDFHPEELASKDRPPNKRAPGAVLINPAALDKLQALRTSLGRPIVLTSAYRTPEHNAHVGGAKSSKHMDGTAFDVVMLNHNPTRFEAAAIKAGFRGIGHYPASNFMHIDDRGGSSVVRFKGTGANNKWFPHTPSEKAPEFTPPPRPTPAKDTFKDLAPIATPIVVGAVPLANGEGPVQWAIAAAILIAMAVGAFWVFTRHKRTERDA